MPEETPEETPNEADVEAEMLRMMQEEVEGPEGGEKTGEEDAPEGGDQSDEAESSDSVDDLLEQEMLRAMEDEGSGGGGTKSREVAPFSGFKAGTEQAEGMERLAEIDVTVTVELGGNLIPIKEILTWNRDSLVALEPEETEPVDVLVNGKLFARGEVVVVGDTFGVRIVEIVAPLEDSGR